MAQGAKSLPKSGERVGSAKAWEMPRPDGAHRKVKHAGAQEVPW